MEASVGSFYRPTTTTDSSPVPHTKSPTLENREDNLGYFSIMLKTGYPLSDDVPGYGSEVLEAKASIPRGGVTGIPAGGRLNV